MNKSKKIGTLILIIIVLSVFLPLIIASVIYSPQYVQRSIFWGPSDVYDFRSSPIGQFRPDPSLSFSGRARQMMRTAFAPCWKALWG
jgi:hypothetical protein